MDQDQFNAIRAWTHADHTRWHFDNPYIPDENRAEQDKEDYYLRVISDQGEVDNHWGRSVYGMIGVGTKYSQIRKFERWLKGSPNIRPFPPTWTVILMHRDQQIQFLQIGEPLNGRNPMPWP